MSVKALDWARRVQAGSPVRKLLLLVIADRVRDGEWETWAGQEALARDAELSVRTVQRTLAEFESDGIIQREHRRRPDGYRTSDVIRLNVGWKPSSPVSVSPDTDSPDRESVSSEQDRSPNPTESQATTTPTSPDRDDTSHLTESQRGDRKLEPEVEPNPSAPPALVLVPDLPSAEDVATERFDEHFWPAWPARNGKKLSKSKALGYWLKLSVDEQRAALRGARNYAAASQAGMAGAKDAFRWLRDREWTDWQSPATPDRPNQPAQVSFPEASSQW